MAGEGFCDSCLHAVSHLHGRPVQIIFFPVCMHRICRVCQERMLLWAYDQGLTNRHLMAKGVQPNDISKTYPARIACPVLSCPSHFLPPPPQPMLCVPDPSINTSAFAIATSPNDTVSSFEGDYSSHRLNTQTNDPTMTFNHGVPTSNTSSTSASSANISLSLTTSSAISSSSDMFAAPPGRILFRGDILGMVDVYTCDAGTAFRAALEGSDPSRPLGPTQDVSLPQGTPAPVPSRTVIPLDYESITNKSRETETKGDPRNMLRMFAKLHGEKALSPGALPAAFSSSIPPMTTWGAPSMSLTSRSSSSFGLGMEDPRPLPCVSYSQHANISSSTSSLSSSSSTNPVSLSAKVLASTLGMTSLPHPRFATDARPPMPMLSTSQPFISPSSTTPSTATSHLPSDAHHPSTPMAFPAPYRTSSIDSVDDDVTISSTSVMTRGRSTSHAGSGTGSGAGSSNVVATSGQAKQSGRGTSSTCTTSNPLVNSPSGGDVDVSQALSPNLNDTPSKSCSQSSTTSSTVIHTPSIGITTNPKISNNGAQTNLHPHPGDQESSVEVDETGTIVLDFTKQDDRSRATRAFAAAEAVARLLGVDLWHNSSTPGPSSSQTPSSASSSRAHHTHDHSSSDPDGFFCEGCGQRHLVTDTDMERLLSHFRNSEDAKQVNALLSSLPGLIDNIMANREDDSSLANFFLGNVLGDLPGLVISPPHLQTPTPATSRSQQTPSTPQGNKPKGAKDVIAVTGMTPSHSTNGNSHGHNEGASSSTNTPAAPTPSQASTKSGTKTKGGSK